MPIKSLNKKTVFTAALVGFALGMVVVSMSSPAGEAFGITTPFGGQIQRTRVCDCSGNLWFQVGPPKNADVVFQTGSILYDYRQINRSGPWVLGTYHDGGVCIYNPPNCGGREHVDGIVVIVGTSN